MKKVLSLFLCAALMISGVPCHVWAADEIAEEGDLVAEEIAEESDLEAEGIAEAEDDFGEDDASAEGDSGRDAEENDGEAGDEFADENDDADAGEFADENGDTAEADSIDENEEEADLLESASAVVDWLLKHSGSQVSGRYGSGASGTYDLVISCDASAGTISFKADNINTGTGFSQYHYLFTYYYNTDSVSKLSYREEVIGATYYTANWDPKTLTEDSTIWFYNDRDGSLISNSNAESGKAIKVLGYLNSLLGTGDFTLADVGFLAWEGGQTSAGSGSSGSGSSASSSIDYGQLKTLVGKLQAAGGSIKEAKRVGNWVYQPELIFEDDTSMDNNDTLVLKCLANDNSEQNYFQIVYDLKRKTAPSKISFYRTGIYEPKEFSVAVNAKTLTPADYSSKKITWYYVGSYTVNKEADWRPAMQYWDAMLHSYGGVSLKTIGFSAYEAALHKVAVTKISLSKTKVSSNVGESFTFSAGVTPKNATNKSVKWSSSNTKVAKVTQSGKVTCVGIGTAKIKAVSADNSSKSATCTLTVAKKLATQSVKVKVASKTYKASALKKRSASFAIGASAKTSLSYQVQTGAKYVSVSKAGKVTVKKGTPKGTYKVVITAKKTTTYKAATKNVTIKVK